MLTPLILAQPEEVVPTAAVSEKNGLEGRWEGVEAMDTVSIYRLLAMTM